jgi:hypothetical protein
MSIASFNEYMQELQLILHELVSSGHTQISELQIDPRSNVRGYINGVLLFTDETSLHFREFVDLTLPTYRAMYAYHYQDGEGNLLFRYDNAAHKPPLAQADHKHTPVGILLCTPPTLRQVLDEIDTDKML